MGMLDGLLGSLMGSGNGGMPATPYIVEDALAMFMKK